MWFLLSLGTALCVGTSDALATKALQTNRSQTVSWVRPGWASFFLLPILFFSKPPSAPFQFWTSILLALPLEITASLILQRSLQQVGLSATMPYLSFTPVFLLGMAWITLRESISPIGMAGVLCVAGGAFFLQPRPSSWRDFLSRPLDLHYKTPILMLLVAFLFALTSILAKRALLASSPSTFCAVYLSVIALGLLPFQGNSKTWARDLFHQPFLFASIGILESLALLFQFQAFLHAKIAYVLAVKRLSLLCAIYYGWVFFKEENIISRALGSLLMLLGAVLIAFAR